MFFWKFNFPFRNFLLPSILLYFDVSGLDGVEIEDARLLLKETESEEIPTEFSINAYPVSQSWDMGTGTKFDEITTDGASWFYRKEGVPWSPIKTHEDWKSGSYLEQGGTYYNNISGSQEFEYKTIDVELDVKNIVEAWVSGSIENDGIIVKHPLEAEKNDDDYGALKFFSKETKTIHQPKLRISWDDQEFTTGSLNDFDDKELHVSFRNFRKEYRLNTEVKIDVAARYLYPAKTFQEEFSYQTVNHYLPRETYYQITDYHSEDVIIPFSEFSKVSCNENGNYIRLNFANWEVDRTYKLEIKTVLNGNELHFDDDYTFNLITE